MRRSQLTLPAPRIEQLRQLAAKLDLSIADTIGEMINEKIAAGLIPDQLPGLQIVKTDTGVDMTVGQAKLHLRPEDAQELRDGLRALLTPGLLNPFLPFERGDILGLERVGVGVKLTDPATGSALTVSRTVAAEVADRLDQAVSE